MSSELTEAEFERVRRVLDAAAGLAIDGSRRAALASLTALAVLVALAVVVVRVRRVPRVLQGLDETVRAERSGPVDHHLPVRRRGRVGDQAQQCWHTSAPRSRILSARFACWCG